MPLNDTLDWQQVGAIVTDPGTGATVADAFQLAFGPPSKDLLHAGMLVYKFNNYPSIAPPPLSPNTAMSPWWTASLPYKHDGGLVQKLKIAEANGVSAREWGRLTSVIKEGWNSLEYLLEIKLAEPVYGWFGGFKGMARGGGAGSMRDSKVEAKGTSKGLPGGGTQFYVPNLTYAQVASYTIKAL